MPSGDQRHGQPNNIDCTGVVVLVYINSLLIDCYFVIGCAILKLMFLDPTETLEFKAKADIVWTNTII